MLIKEIEKENVSFLKSILKNQWKTIKTETIPSLKPKNVQEYWEYCRETNKKECQCLQYIEFIKFDKEQKNKYELHLKNKKTNHYFCISTENIIDEFVVENTVQNAIEFFVNAEKAALLTSKCLKQAKNENRLDSIDSYLSQLIKIVSLLDCSEVVKN